MSDTLHDARKKVRIVRIVLFIGILLAVIKFYAWHVTSSDAILSDALESLINIVAAGFGLFTLVYAGRPKDQNHPYGHGKMEFVAVGFEGALIFFTGCAIIVRAVMSFADPRELRSVDIGMALLVFAGAVNFVMGRYLVIKGRRLHSSAMTADGQHLLTDTYTSIVVLGGLFLYHLTGKLWIDPALTLLMGSYILFVGYRLIRNSLAGLMDESDFEKIRELIAVINSERKAAWIDIHNLRVVKYGSNLHVDLHLTLPWYDQLKTSHEEVKSLEKLVNRHFENRIEFFIHTDPCISASCEICTLFDCTVREHPFKQKLEWDLDLLMKNKRHDSGVADQ